AVQDAIAIYRGGGQLTSDDDLAFLSMALSDLRIRDDAWARMDPEHSAAHQRLWTDLTRRACPQYRPAPASLLAFTAWQAGRGAASAGPAMRRGRRLSWPGWRTGAAVLARDYGRHRGASDWPGRTSPPAAATGPGGGHGPGRNRPGRDGPARPAPGGRRPVAV